MGPGDIGRHHRRHVLGTTRDLCRLERRAEARVRRVQDDLGALEHHAPCNFGHHEFAAGNDADAAKRRVGHREHLVIGRDLQVIGHEIVDRREGCGVDPAIAAQDLAIRADQDAGVEVTARPFLGGLEHVPCDIDAFAPCQRLQRLGQRPGHGRTGPPHPVGHRHAQRRALHGELGEHHQVGAVGPGQRLFDQPDKSRLVPRDHPGRGPVVGGQAGPLAEHLDTGCAPGGYGHDSFFPVWNRVAPSGCAPAVYHQSATRSCRMQLFRPPCLQRLAICRTVPKIRAWMASKHTLAAMVVIHRHTSGILAGFQLRLTGLEPQALKLKLQEVR